MDVFWIVLVYGIVKLITILCTVELNKLVGSIHIIRLYPFFFIGCVLKRLNFTPPQLEKGGLDSKCQQHNLVTAYLEYKHIS